MPRMKQTATPKPVPTPPAPPPAPSVLPADLVPAALADLSADPERIRLGQAEGLLHRVPVGIVQYLLAGFRERVATLRDSQAVRDLQPRVHATEGRCAPLYFVDRGPGVLPALVAGIEGFAAAMNLGVECVFVITVVSEDAGALHDFVATAAHRETPAETDDDFLMQVMSLHRE